MLQHQYHNGAAIEAGCDEAGRGALAGPVVAAAVLLSPGFRAAAIDDSKKLSPPQRDLMAQHIKQHATAWAIGSSTTQEIDTINILQAAIMAMHRALRKLRTGFDSILVDGNYFHAYAHTPHVCIVGGDGKYLSIAAASILAKTHRDKLMRGLHRQYPQYGWWHNKGYPTRQHRTALLQYGLCEHHRKSFACIKKPAVHAC